MDEFNKETAAEQEQAQHNTKKLMQKFATKLRNDFFTGILVLMPLVLTLWIFKSIIISLDKFMQSFVPIEYIQKLTVKYDNAMLESIIGQNTIPGLGLLIGLFGIIFVGMFAKNVIGKKLFSFGDKIFHKTPIIRTIYSSLQQITTTISNTGSASFREVVLVEYPRKDCWVMAFVSGNTTHTVKKQLDKNNTEDFINVFVPTTPNPTSGFLIFVPRSSVKKLSMTVEQGLKLVISAGIVAPVNELIETEKRIEEEELKKADL